MAMTGSDSMLTCFEGSSLLVSLFLALSVLVRLSSQMLPAAAAIYSTTTTTIVKTAIFIRQEVHAVFSVFIVVAAAGYDHARINTDCCHRRYSCMISIVVLSCFFFSLFDNSNCRQARFAA